MAVAAKSMSTPSVAATKLREQTYVAASVDQYVVPIRRPRRGRLESLETKISVYRSEGKIVADSVDAKLETYQRQMGQHDLRRQKSWDAHRAHGKGTPPQKQRETKEPLTSVKDATAVRQDNNGAAGEAQEMAIRTGGRRGRGSSFVKMNMGTSEESPSRPPRSASFVRVSMDASPEAGRSPRSRPPSFVRTAITTTDVHVAVPRDAEQLLHFRYPSRPLFRLAYARLASLESTGDVQKLLLLRDARGSSSKSTKTAGTPGLRAVLKVITGVVEKSLKGVDLEQEIERQNLTETLRKCGAASRVFANFELGFKAAVREVVVESDSCDDTAGRAGEPLLASLLRVHHGSPTIVTALCCWLYGKAMITAPERYALPSQTACTWKFLSLLPVRKCAYICAMSLR